MDTVLYAGHYRAYVACPVCGCCVPADDSACPVCWEDWRANAIDAFATILPVSADIAWTLAFWGCAILEVVCG